MRPRTLRPIGFLAANWFDLVGFLADVEKFYQQCDPGELAHALRRFSAPVPLEFARFGGVRAVSCRKLAVFEELDFEVLCDFLCSSLRGGSVLWIWHWFWGGFASRFDPIPGFYGNLYSAGFGNFGLEVEGKASLLFTPSRKVWSGLFSAGLVLRSSSGLVLCQKKRIWDE